jgi:hypothetical protein
MIASTVFRARYNAFTAACANPLQMQAARLRTMLAESAHTEQGRRHGYGRIAAAGSPEALIAAFQSAVPVRTHEEMRGELEAVHDGHWRALCPTPPVFFAMTAGSTGRFKHIPVTERFRRDLGRASQVFAGALEATFPALRGLRTQFLVGSAEGGRSPAGIPQGFISGFNYRHLPWLIRRTFVVPYWVFTVADASERAYAIGRILADSTRVGALCAITPMNLIQIREALEANVPRLVDDIAQGTLTIHGDPAIAGDFRTAPDGARARHIATHWSRHGVLPIRDVCRSLRVMVCWHGGSMGYHLRDLDAAFETTGRFEFPLSASEGVIAIPCGPAPGATLAIGTHFLEFLPEGSTRGPALRADQLDPGGLYSVVVTNSAGLHRYNMEDLVRVTGHFARTPTVEFVSKTSRQVSIANERLNEGDVVRAMTAASRVTNIWIDDFLFVPCRDGRYRVIVDGAELDGSVDRAAGIARLAAELEQQLRATATGYDFERDDALLAPLQVAIAAPGELAAFVGSRGARHTLPNAQGKPLHLAAEFDAHLRFTLVATHGA